MVRKYMSFVGYQSEAKLPLDFNVIPKAASWLNVAGMVCSLSILATYFVLPVSRTSRHYLTVGLVVAVCLLQVKNQFDLISGTPADQCSSALLSLLQQNRNNAMMLLHRTTCTLILPVPSREHFCFSGGLQLSSGVSRPTDRIAA